MKFKKLTSIMCIILTYISAFSQVSYASEIPLPLTEPTETSSSDISIEAEAAVLIDAETGCVIYDKNKDIKKFPASITKIMTAMLALENAKLDERVLFSHQAVFSLPYNSSHIAMDEDESLSMEQSLYAIMLESANEVSNAVAEHLGGTNEGFAEMMNKKAKDLGAKNTHFTNPHGLHDENHYTTAYDMALIMQAAIKNPEFIKIISTQSMKLPPTEKQPLERPLNNNHKMIFSGNANYHENVVGGKTGFTTEAGNTLVTYAKKDEKGLIAVILHDSSAKASYTDTKTLLDYGFNTYCNVNIFDSKSYMEKINVVYEKEGLIREAGIAELYAKEDITMNLPSTLSKDDIILKSNISYQISPPVALNQKVGTLDIMYNGNVLKTVDLYSKSEVPIPKDMPSEEKNTLAEKKGSTLTGISKNFVLILKIAGFIAVFLTVISVSSRIVRIRRRNRRKRQLKYRNSYYMKKNNYHYRYRNN